jgi:hypothetical protein
MSEKLNKFELNPILLDATFEQIWTLNNKHFTKSNDIMTDKEE